MRTVGKTAVQIGGQLEIADQIRQDASMSRDAIFYFNNFASDTLDWQYDNTREPEPGKNVCMVYFTWQIFRPFHIQILPPLLTLPLKPDEHITGASLLQSSEMVLRLLNIATNLASNVKV